MRERLTYTPDQQIEAKFGKEYLEQTEGMTRQIMGQIKQSLVDIGNSEGSSNEQLEEARKLIEMWKEFSNNVFARTSSENLKSPATVETAIKGANALMSPEPTRDGETNAKAIIDQLEKRYGADK